MSIAVAHEVSIWVPSKVGNSPELQPGTYRLEIVKNQDSAEVQFFLADDLVATVPVTLAKETAKSDYTAVHSREVEGGQVITKIYLRGLKESLVFEE